MPDTHVVVVTGSASGIGRATASRYLAEGATVYGLDRVIQPEAPAPGGTWTGKAVDVLDDSSIRAAFDDILRAEGHVDVLVTSAGVGYPEPFAEIGPESWDRVFGINVTGTMLCIQQVFGPMVERGSGAIIIISSIAGRTKSVANGAHYTASKYGLIGLTRHLAAELAGTGVRINCVAPGPTISPLLTDSSDAAALQAIADRTPLRRLAEPDDIAAVVHFAASAAARQIHGAILDVNGGMY